MPFALSRARIVTLRPHSRGVRRGAALRDLGVITHGYVVIDDALCIQRIDAGDPPRDIPAIDLGGRTLMPTWVDCHTHACFAGDRTDEWTKLLAGIPYLEILRAGGGIHSTVRSVRETSRTALTALLSRRLERMHALGTGVAEVKTGYGLTVESEARMLDAILDAQSDMRVVPTFLGAHALDPANPNWVRECIDMALPAAAKRLPSIACDCFCEKGAWSKEDCITLMERARTLGCPIRVHTDQFTQPGLIADAVQRGARTIDHLESSSPQSLALIAKSETIGVGLPVSPYCLSTPFMNGRQFIDFGGAIAIASNFNPGSAPTPSVAFAAALAVRSMGLTPEEAITAATWNGACALGLEHEAGALHEGQPARLQVIDATDERAAVLELAGGGPALVLTSRNPVGTDRTLVAAVMRALHGR
ncbi:MAG: imidazolonepropionase [Planctomycetota bacterium]|nr:imidazolonepropionase [Planctomycetota bacterium]